MKKQNYKALLLVLIAALTLEATSFTQYFFSQNVIKEEASLRAEGQLEVARNRILDVTNQTEAAVRNSMWIARWCLDVPDSLQVVARRVVEDNPVVMGSTVALVPGYYSQHPLFAPYACRKGEVIEMKTLATPQYDYPSQEWFAKPLELGESYWSEPYIDEGGGNILMTTYSVPLKDYREQTAAVLTADVSLEWLSQLVNSMQVYDNAYGVVLSRQGKVMVGPDETQNKETKIIVYAPWVKAHVIFKDVSMYTPGSDYGVMMSFLLGYTTAGKNTHDDVPDAFASLAKWKSRAESLPPVVGRRPF